jgi:uncharacterized protein
MSLAVCDPHVWPLTAAGNLLNRAASSVLQPAYAPCTSFVCGQLNEMLGDELISIYLRGSVALGEAVPNRSDLDLLVLTRSEPEAELEALREAALNAFPFLEDVDIGLCRADDVGVTLFGTCVQSYLLVEARLLAGRDLALDKPAMRPDAKFARSRFPDFETEANWLMGMLIGTEPLAHYRGVVRPASFWAKWTMRAVMRTTHLVAMTSTGLYSNHLATCCKLALDHFPENTEWIQRAFENERHLTSDPAESAVVLRWWRETMLPLWRDQIESLAQEM